MRRQRATVDDYVIHFDEYPPPPPPATRTCSYELDTETVVETRYGALRYKISLGQCAPLEGYTSSATTSITEGDMHLVEVRQLLDGGLLHAQVGDMGMLNLSCVVRDFSGSDG